MKPEIDAIVASLPPPGKKKPGGDDEVAEGEDYNPEEAAAVAMGKALGIPEADIDVPALCSALRDFNATASAPTEE